MPEKGRRVGVKVDVPASLRRLTGGRRWAEARGRTVGEVLAELERRHSGLRARLRDESGEMRRTVLVFLNAEDIRLREGEETAVREGDELVIVPAIEGG